MSGIVARVRLFIVLAVGATLCALAFAGPSMASQAYPPTAPSCSAAASVSTTSSCSAGAGAADAQSGSAQTSSDTTESKDNSALAGTGFDSGLAIVVVAALVAAGALCLVAGSRRRRT